MKIYKKSLLYGALAFTLCKASGVQPLLSRLTNGIRDIFPSSVRIT